MMNAYLTIVNDRYALRALALYRSLAPHMADKQFRVYCIDDKAADVLEALSIPKCTIVRTAGFETDELRDLRRQRAVNEYCWTLKPVALQHALAAEPTLDWAVYLDSDVMVFGDPDAELRAQPSAHVLLTPHRPTVPYFADFIENVGIFNAGYAAFHNTDIGRAALSWWRDRCFEDCPNVRRNDAYADQRYLNRLPELFEGTVSSQHRGLNAGPWNILDQTVEFDGERVLVGGNELLTYHMQGFRILGQTFFNLYAGPVRVPPKIRKLIYRPYALTLIRAYRELWRAPGSFASPPDERFWKPVTVLQEMRKAVRGQTNLYPVFWEQ